jgi:hypothetical protein
MFDQALNSHLAALESPPTDDLKSYRAIERPPVRGTYRRYDIPPPSSGGDRDAQHSRKRRIAANIAKLPKLLRK